jgi:hypothetical protein
MRHLAWIVLTLACFAPAAAKVLGPDDAVAVSGIVQERLKATDINVSMVAEKPYAIAYWNAGAGYGAGEALAKNGKSGWAIVKITTGRFKDVAILEGLGVPSATAKALVFDLKVAGH